MTGDDTGAADPRLAAALAAWAADRTSATESEVHAALLGARLLVAVVPVPAAEQAGAGTGVRGGKVIEMGLATLTARGRSALPAFTALDTLGRWRSDARPVPVPGARLLAAARAEHHDAVVLDAAGPVAYVVADAALDALAHGYVPVDGPLAARLADARRLGPPRESVWPEGLAAALSADPDVAAAYLLDVDGETVVGVQLRGGCGLAPVAHRLAARLAEPISLVPLTGELLPAARAVGVPLLAPGR